MATWRVNIGRHEHAGAMGLMVSKPDVNVNTTPATDRVNLLFSSEWTEPTAMVLQSGLANQGQQVLFSDPGYAPVITFARRTAANTWLEGETYYRYSSSSGQRLYQSLPKWALSQGTGHFVIDKRHSVDSTTGQVFRYIIWSLPSV